MITGIWRKVSTRINVTFLAYWYPRLPNTTSCEVKTKDLTDSVFSNSQGDY